MVGRGYYVYTVGDRTLDFTGTVNQGTVSLPVTYTTGAGHDPTAVGWNVVSNPYPSAIDWDDPAWTKTNIANQFAIYDAQNNVFASYAGGVGTNMLGRTDQSVIPAFQAFWVLATGASPVLEANEGVKINNNEGFYGRPGDPADLMRIYVSDGASTDEAIVRTGATYVDVYNGSEDAVKFFSFSPTAPTVYSLTSDNVNASINAFSPFSGGEIIPLRIRGNTIRFESTFSSVNFALGSDAEGYLFDIVVDSTYTINTSGLENYYLIVNTGASPLPVDLVSFSAEPQASHVALAWETASEYNSSHFVVQKSTNGSVFNDLATVKAAGFSSSANTYEAQDFEPTNGLNYYRLKQFDFDGSSETFNTLVVSWNAQTQESKQIQVLTEALGYTLIVPEQAIVGYRVFDTKGALLQIEEAHNGNSVFVPRAEGLSIIQLELEDGETIELKLP